jgi:hypothetical protein
VPVMVDQKTQAVWSFAPEVLDGVGEPSQEPFLIGGIGRKEVVEVLVEEGAVAGFGEIGGGEPCVKVAIGGYAGLAGFIHCSIDFAALGPFHPLCGEEDFAASDVNVAIRIISILEIVGRHILKAGNAGRGVEFGNLARCPDIDDFVIEGV